MSHRIPKKMKFSREQYLDLMTFRPVDRPMFVELFGLLVGVDKEWRAQGATEDEISLKAFDWDHVWAEGVIGCDTHPIGRWETEIIEDNDEFQTQRDFLGRTLMLCKATATLPLPLNFPVKTMDDWLRFKPRYVFSEDRIDWNGVEQTRKLQRDGIVIEAGIPGAFDTVRELMGEEVACLNYYEDPELMHDIIDTISDTSMKVWERVSEKLVIDTLSVHEDLAGKSGPLIGPTQIREYFKPYFRPLWDMLSSRGTRIFQMDTDGDINPVLDDILDCGLNAIHPMEPAAGMDIVELRKKYGTRLAMRGGIDKHVLRRTKEEIRRELEYKLQPMMIEAGGMAFSLDHRIPNGTSLENYRYYVDLGREMLGMPPLRSEKSRPLSMAV